jgi:Flp pilus assembly protein TadG
MFARLRQKLGPLARRFRRHDGGATAVEFGLLVAPFVAILFVIIEGGLAFFADAGLEASVQRASRLIKTGQAQQAGYTADQFRTAICDFAVYLPDCSGKLKVDVRTIATFDSANTTPPIVNGVTDYSKFTYSAGKGGDIVIVRAYYEWPTILNFMSYYLADTASGKRLLSGVDVFRNEPFPW